MHLVILTNLYERSLAHPDEFLRLEGLENALLGHKITRLAAKEKPPLEVARTLTSVDFGVWLNAPVENSYGAQALEERGKKIYSAADIQSEWFLKTLPLANSLPQAVFCPSIAEPQFSQAVYERMSSLRRTLFLANSAADLKLGASPDFRTFYSPYFPDAQTRAIASAALVVSFRKSAALSAAALGVPVLFVTANTNDALEMEPIGIPCVLFQQTDWASTVAHRVEEKISRTLLPLSRSQREVPRRWQEEQLHTVLPLRATPPRVSVAQGRIRIACISDWTYLPYLLGFASNLRAIHTGPVDLYFLAMDDRTEAFLRESSLVGGGQIYRMEELWEPSEQAYLETLTVARRAYCSKSRLVLRVLKEHAGPVLYSDADIFFYESPSSWMESLPEATVSFCPQRHSRIDDDRHYGFFQAGLFVANSGSEAFLQWWRRVTSYKCLNTQGSHNYYFFDQGYLDLAPLFFPEFSIEWSGEHNIAEWNFNSYGIFPDPQSPWRPCLLDGRPVKSLHVAFPDRYGFDRAKNAWDHLALFFSRYPLSDAGELLPATITNLAPYFDPFCWWFEIENKANFYLRFPILLKQRPRLFALAWRSPFRRLLSLLALMAKKGGIDLIAKKKNKRHPHRPPRFYRRWMKANKLPATLPWADMVTELMERRKPLLGTPAGSREKASMSSQAHFQISNQSDVSVTDLL